MNSCKQCGKEVDNKHRFCSLSCAAKYNNQFRIHNRWTEEQKQRVSQARRIKNDQARILAGQKRYYTEDGNTISERYCKYCGKPSKGAVCSECENYNKPSLYRKLGLTTGSLKDRYEKAFNILYQAYFKENLSVWCIFDRYGICHSTLKTVFNDHGVELRTLQEGSRIGTLEGRVKSSCGKGNQYHCGWHTTWQGTKIYYRSSYELKYAEQLDSQRVKYEVESKRIKYYSSKDQKVHIAVPDFYLPDTNELVEIKSSWTYNEQNMKDKFKAYRESGYNPILILEGREIQI